MNAFADSLIQMLLNIMQVIFNGVYGLFERWQASGFLQWLAEHWLGIVVFFVIVGLVIDLAVWFFKWQPYYVWQRKINRFINWVRRQGRAIKDPTYRQALTAAEQEQQRADILQRLGQGPTSQAKSTTTTHLDPAPVTGSTASSASRFPSAMPISGGPVQPPHPVDAAHKPVTFPPKSDKPSIHS